MLKSGELKKFVFPLKLEEVLALLVDLNLKVCILHIHFYHPVVLLVEVGQYVDPFFLKCLVITKEFRHFRFITGLCPYPLSPSFGVEKLVFCPCCCLLVPASFLVFQGHNCGVCCFDSLAGRPIVFFSAAATSSFTDAVIMLE